MTTQITDFRQCSMCKQIERFIEFTDEDGDLIRQCECGDEIVLEEHLDLNGSGDRQGDWI